VTAFISHSENGQALSRLVTGNALYVTKSTSQRRESVCWHTRKDAIIIWPTAQDGTFGTEQIRILNRDTRVV